MILDCKKLTELNWVIDHTCLSQLVGDLKELKEKDYGDLAPSLRNKLKVPFGDKKVSKEFEGLSLNDIEVIQVQDHDNLIKSSDFQVWLGRMFYQGRV